MFSKIKAWITGEVASIETILKGWYSAVEQLEQHAEAKVKEAAAHAANVLHLTQMAQAATTAEKEAKDASVQALHIAQQIKQVVTSSANATPAA